MSSRPVLSPEERDLVLRQARMDASGTRIPVRTMPPARAPGMRGTGRAGGSPGPRGPVSGSLGASRPPHGPGDGAGFQGDESRGVTLPKRSRRWRKALLSLFALVMIVLGLGVGKFLNVGSSVLNPERSIIAQLADLLFRRGALDGEKENRTNILLVAIGGEGHQGENLADTIIVASFRPQEKDVALLSIPRDLYVNIPGTELFSRINAVHAYGEQQRRGEGLNLLRKKVAEATGQPVHYVARVDFKAFKEIVDEIGGIDIAIPQSFYDYWHKISFPQGTEHMNGERALAYVRARYVEGSEGGDFKRAERTQQVLLTIRKKLLSVQTAVDIRALAGILDALQDNVATNFNLSELKRLSELTRDIPEDRIHSAVLTTGAEGLLVGTTEQLDGRPASVLRPRAGLENFSEIQEFARDVFAQARIARPTEKNGAPSPESLRPPAASPSPATVKDEQPTIEFRNGTPVTGLASRVSKTFAKSGFTVAGVGNAAIRNRAQTVVVDRTGGKKPTSLQEVLRALPNSTSVSFPDGEASPTDADFIVFLGTDVAEKFKK